MKFAKVLLALAVAASVSTTLTACGTRTVTTLPPTEAELPKNIGTMTITVVDNNSKPVAGAAVSLTDAKGKAVMEEVTSGEDGKATFKNVPIGQGYVVTAEDGGVTGSQAGLGIDGDAPLVVTIMLVAADAAKGTIGGTVIDAFSNSPIEGATVSIVGTQTTVTSRADGSFLLQNVPAGAPAVVAKFNGYRESRQNVALRAGKLEQISFKLAPTGDAARMGHTVITSAKSVFEIDKFNNRVATRSGAAQARTLTNGNTLVASGAGVTEINASNLTVWTYRPLLVGRLGNPQGVDRSEAGNVFIADTNNNRVLEVNPGRNVERKIQTSLNKPMGVDYVEATRSVLIADTGNNRVIEVGADGKIVWGVGDGTTGILNHPAFAQRLTNGNTLICDTGNSRVMEINRAQKLVWMYGGKGNKADCFLPNSAVRLPNGNTLIADTGNNRVIEVTGAGAVAWQLPGLEAPLFAERL